MLSTDWVGGGGNVKIYNFTPNYSTDVYLPQLLHITPTHPFCVDFYFGFLNSNPPPPPDPKFW